MRSKPKRRRFWHGVRWERVGLAVAVLFAAIGLAWIGVSRAIAALAHPAVPALPAAVAAIPVADPQPTLLPAKPWSDGERERLTVALSNAFAAPEFANAGLVVLAQDGKPLFSRNARTPMTPASTLKVVVAATALENLGADYRFETSFAADGDIDSAGELHGPLWLVGSGDPLLVSNDLRGGAQTLARAGLRKVDDGLAVDDLAFAGPEVNPHWDPDDLEEGYAPPTSAVSLDEDTVEFHVTPGTPGEAARVTIEPPNDRVTFDGTISTYDGYDTDLTIDRTQQAQNAPNRDAAANDFVLQGHIASGVMQKYWKPVRNVADYVGGAAVKLLGERGIDVSGDVRRGAAPAGAKTLWTHRSPRVAAIVDEMLVDSNNHSAEQFLRTLGKRDGRGGTDESGLAAERALLAQLNVPHGGFDVHDGSGLSPGDRIAPMTLAGLLDAELARPAGGYLFAALPRPGIEGTVKYHHLTDALERVHAKSGHISGVNGLTGVIKTKHHGFVTFAFIVNHPDADADAVTNGQDEAMDTLAAR